MVTVVDCGTPPPLENGKLTVTPPVSATLGATVTYECDDGYEFGEGSAMNRTCLDTGEWSNEDIKCNLKTSNEENSECMPVQNITSFYHNFIPSITCITSFHA